MTIDIAANKTLGQNFLVNEGVLDRIISAAALTPADTVLEVGPGRGALTRRLATTGARVIAVEKDRRLIEPLRDEFARFTNVTIIEGDILKLDIASLNVAANSYAVVANIPYYLTSHLLRRMLSRWPTPSRAILMVQYEVARRILATPPRMNLLALSVQLYAMPSLVMRVSRGSFRPMPGVDSALISLLVTSEADRALAERVLALARQAFSRKRKQLVGLVSPELLELAGIPPKARPQELSVDAWKKVVTNLP